MSYDTLDKSAASHDWHNCARVLLRELWLRPVDVHFALASRALREGTPALNSRDAAWRMDDLLHQRIADLINLRAWPELEPDDPAEASYELAVDAYRLLLQHRDDKAMATINAVVAIYQSITARQLRLLGGRLDKMNSAALHKGLRENEQSAKFGETAWADIDRLLRTKYSGSVEQARVFATSLSRESLEHYLEHNMFLPVGELPPGVG